MEITGEDYQINYYSETVTVNCQGMLRLNGMEEYAPIMQLLDDIIDHNYPLVQLDLRKLEFLNSSGINMLSKFIIKVRQKKNVQVVIHGSQRILWQGKSLRNLQRLMPSLQLEWH